MEIENDHLLKWERVGYLSRNVKYVDSTVLRIEDKTYIFCYTEENHHYATHIYRIEPKTLFMEEVFKESHQENIFRPAGNFFRNDEGKLIRPLQYNKKSYGEYIEFSEIESITPLKERIFKRVSVQDLRNQMGIKRMLRIHIHTQFVTQLKYLMYWKGYTLPLKKFFSVFGRSEMLI